jgi:hypothetical protein
VKQSGNAHSKCRITFYKVRKACDLYDNPGAEISEVQKVELEEHNSSHEAEDASVSNVATEILSSNISAVRESPIENKYFKKNIKETTM